MQTYESVLNRIEEGLQQGRWTLGDRLPSERALSEEFSVSRASVREALRVLEAMGIIRRGTGSGPEAGAILIDKPAAGLGAAMRLHMASGATKVSDVVQLRLLVEKWAVEQVAAQCAAATEPTQLDPAQGAATLVPTDLSKARQILDEMVKPGTNLTKFQQLDTQFHVELVALAGNPLMEATMLAIRTSVQQYVALGMDRLNKPTQYVEQLHQQHLEIVDLIVAGDAAGASRAVEEHISGFYQTALT